MSHLLVYLTCLIHIFESFTKWRVGEDITVTALSLEPFHLQMLEFDIIGNPRPLGILEGIFHHLLVTVRGVKIDIRVFNRLSGFLSLIIQQLSWKERPALAKESSVQTRW